MIDNNTIPSEQYSFKDFLFNNRRNRITLLLAGVAIVIQFAVFKYLYPFASFIHGDSFEYLETAFHNYNVNDYLIGYSKFLRLFSVFSKSDTVLVCFQYLSIQASALLFIFSIFYFFRISQFIQYTLLIIITFNPLFLHLGNLISSDGVFAVISFCWFTSLVWILKKGNNFWIIIQAITLLIAFTLRYNAIIYPLVSLAAISLSNISFKRKIFGFTAGIAACGIFFVYTSFKFY